MKKQIKGWKVISTDGRTSARSKFEGVDKAVYVLTYPVGVKVTPKDKNSKLFFFINENDARNFIGYDKKVVPCIATGVSKIKYISYFRENFKLFWQRKKNKKSSAVAVYDNVPEGTFVAESITCLE